MQKRKVAIVGASGYTGAELVRLLLSHPQAEIAALTGDTQAGKAVEEVYPHLAGLGLPSLVRAEDANLADMDAVFLALPHGQAQAMVAGLPKETVVIDLSADFRLRDPAVYAEWYGLPHQAPDRQRDAVFGLTEHYRDAVKTANLIACPGCYPTSVMLPLIPLYKAGLVDGAPIIDAKSGITGAGRGAKQANLFAEIDGGISVYGVTRHRHVPEIEQELSCAAGKAVGISFTPHLMPMSRGILSTIYVKGDAAAIRAAWEKAYAHEPFVTVLAPGVFPATHSVRGTNRCLMNVFPDRQAGHAILVSVIDNLVKGASGQAVQNFNVRFGFPETTGLPPSAVFP